MGRGECDKVDLRELCCDVDAKSEEAVKLHGTLCLEQFTQPG